ncbi:MAG: YggS family pyridoxal phosphate-dependent enzyme [Actinobacteria bacterium]|nr:YggS family pyridoxal phosphate-dependent enzyme [Actinomycetota bacterium]MBU1866751.1 YggS family pyridoxal phosphate-dependent enzyme [Actinomycetota bacterium]
MGGLTEIRERMMAAAGRAGRDPAAIRLVAVTKTATPEAIVAAYRGGQRDFGENRADRLAAGAALLPDARWHMIGRLQGNKVRVVRKATALLHSLDRPELVEYWAAGDAVPPPVLIQVNVGEDPKKAGVAVGAAGRLADLAVDRGLEVRGLMTIPPLTPDPEDARVHFRALAGLRDRLREAHPTLVDLSMGMTDDFEVAIEEGATLLRVGRAIFGEFEENRG